MTKQENTQTIRQFIDLMDADERLIALQYLMRELPPSAVREIYEQCKYIGVVGWWVAQNGSELEVMEVEYWKDYKEAKR